MRAPLRKVSSLRTLLAVAASAVLAAPAFAFDSKGHNVIEATAYRTLVEGHGGQPPRPDVLRDLINDGALDAPWCFGRGDKPPTRLPRRAGRKPAPLLAPARDRPAGCLLPAPVQRLRPVLPLHGNAHGQPLGDAPRHDHPPRPRDERRRPLQRPPRRPPPAGRRGRRPRHAPERLRALRDDARGRGLLLGLAHGADGGPGRLSPRLEADREDRRDPDRALEEDPRQRLPQVGRPPGQDVRRRGGRGGVRERAWTIRTTSRTSASPPREIAPGRRSSSSSSS